MQKKVGLFVMSATKEGDYHTIIAGPSKEGKSLMSDNSDLTMHLATKAFEMIGSDDFTVSAELSADNVAGLIAFGKLQSILLMAYKEGQANSRVALNGYELKDALAFIAPDDDADQLETEVAIALLDADKAPKDDDGKSMGVGHYAWLADYPEEGCIRLTDEPSGA